MDFGELSEIDVLIELSPVPMLLLDVDTLEIRRVNVAAVELYRWPKHELEGMSVLDIWPDAERAHFRGRVDCRLPPESPGAENIRSIGTWRHRRSDGVLLVVQVITTGVMIAGRAHRLAYVIDQSERIQAELERDRAVHRLIELQELLHNDIAERLHDGPVQTLTAASLRIGMLRRGCPKAIADELGIVEALTIDALQGLRREMEDQRAPREIANDFAGLIRSLLARFGLHGHYVVRAIGGEPSHSVGSTLYRVAQRVLATSTLSADVDDPWIIDIEITPTESIMRFPVAFGSGLTPDLIDWTLALQGSVHVANHTSHEHFTVSFRAPQEHASGVEYDASALHPT